MLRALGWVVGLAACASDGTEGSPSAVRGPGGVVGICCPIDPGNCNAFRYGGWARSLGECPTVSDAAPPTRTELDLYGCPVLRASGSCLSGPSGDAGADVSNDAAPDT